MRTARSIALGTATAAALVIGVGLTGCDALTDSLHHERQGTASSTGELLHDWSTPASEPSWVPADAVRIRWVFATTGPADETPAAVRVASRSALPAFCTEVDRRSLASFRSDWAPATFPRRIRRCDGWAVMRVHDGWYGWTPFAEPES